MFLATLAHELRNPLAPIGNALQIMRMSADAGAHDQRPRHDRAPAAPAGPSRRRPARRQPHLAGQGRAAQASGSSSSAVIANADRDQPAGDRRRPPRSGARAGRRPRDRRRRRHDAADPGRSPTCSTTPPSTRRRAGGSRSRRGARASRRSSASPTPASASRSIACPTCSRCSRRSIARRAARRAASASAWRWSSGWSRCTAARSASPARVPAAAAASRCACRPRTRPAARRVEAAPGQRRTAAGHGARILVADDNRDSADSMAAMLTPDGLRDGGRLRRRRGAAGRVGAATARGDPRHRHAAPERRRGGAAAARRRAVARHDADRALRLGPRRRSAPHQRSRLRPPSGQAARHRRPGRAARGDRLRRQVAP